MASGRVGIVRDQNIAGFNSRKPIMLDLRLHRLRHSSDEHRQPEANRDGIAIGRKQANREIERFVNDQVIRSSRQIGLHLLGNGQKAIADYFDGHWIDGVSL